MNYKTSIDLYAASVVIGHGWDQAEIKPATIGQLLELGMLTRSQDDKVELTAAGDKAFSRIEGGDYVREFGNPDDIEPEPGCE